MKAALLLLQQVHICWTESLTLSTRSSREILLRSLTLTTAILLRLHLCGVLVFLEILNLLAAHPLHNVICLPMNFMHVSQWFPQSKTRGNNHHFLNEKPKPSWL